MNRFPNEGSNEQEEGRQLIRAPSKGEQEEPLDLSFEGVAGARTLSRRQALGLLGGSLAGVSLFSLGLATPAKSQQITEWEFVLPFQNFDHITLEWIGTPQPFTPWPSYSLLQSTTTPTNKFLDGRTDAGDVVLSPNTNPPFTGTRWEVVRRNPGTYPPTWWLRCLGDKPGPRWLDGRTHNGTVGLAPDRSAPYTGTRWEIHRSPYKTSTPDEIWLKCLGDVPGPRMLTGYSYRRAVALTEDEESLWRVRILPK